MAGGGLPFEEARSKRLWTEGDSITININDKAGWGITKRGDRQGLNLGLAVHLWATLSVSSCQAAASAATTATETTFNWEGVLQNRPHLHRGPDHGREVQNVQVRQRAAVAVLAAKNVQAVAHQSGLTNGMQQA